MMLNKGNRICSDTNNNNDDKCVFFFGNQFDKFGDSAHSHAKNCIDNRKCLADIISTISLQNKQKNTEFFLM